MISNSTKLRRTRLIFNVGLLCFLMGCGCRQPACDFKASRTHICTGADVTLTWDTGGNPVSIEPGIGSVSASGSRTVRVDRTTAFTLTSTREGRSESRTVTIDVVPSGGTSETIFSRIPDCEAHPRVSRDFVPSDWDERIRVTTVVNTQSEPVTVSHTVGSALGGETRSQELAPGNPNSSFERMTLSGNWTLTGRDRVVPRSCTDPTGANPGGPPPPAPPLGISIQVVCRF